MASSAVTPRAEMTRAQTRGPEWGPNRLDMSCAKTAEQIVQNVDCGGPKEPRGRSPPEKGAFWAEAPPPRCGHSSKLSDCLLVPVQTAQEDASDERGAVPGVRSDGSGRFTGGQQGRISTGG